MSPKVQQLTDKAVELEIQLWGTCAEIAQARMEAGDGAYFDLAGLRDKYTGMMRDCILARSPAQIERMELARGLAA